MKNALLLILIVAFISGCKENPVTPSSQPTGLVSGRAFLFNETGDSVISSGVLISVSGTNQTTMTDASGKWSIIVPKGSYTLTFTKDGYGAMKVFGVATKGNDTVSVDEVDMTVPSHEYLNFQMLRVTEESDSIPAYLVQGTMEQKTETLSMVLFVSADSAALALDPNSSQVSIPFTLTGNGYDGGFTWSSTSTFSLQQNNPFPHGTKVYTMIAIYGKGDESAGFSNYLDPVLNKQIYTALGPHSQIIRQVIP